MGNEKIAGKIELQIRKETRLKDLKYFSDYILEITILLKLCCQYLKSLKSCVKRPRFSYMHLCTCRVPGGRKFQPFLLSCWQRRPQLFLHFWWRPGWTWRRLLCVLRWWDFVTNCSSFWDSGHTNVYCGVTEAPYSRLLFEVSHGAVYLWRFVPYFHHSTHWASRFVWVVS